MRKKRAYSTVRVYMPSKMRLFALVWKPAVRECMGTSPGDLAIQ